VAQAAKGCDILFHEVHFEKGLAARTPHWHRCHSAYHTSAPDVGRVAAEAQPGKVALYHLLPMGETPEVIEEVRRNFLGLRQRSRGDPVEVRKNRLPYLRSRLRWGIGATAESQPRP